MSGGWDRPSLVQVQLLPAHVCSDARRPLGGCRADQGWGSRSPGICSWVGPLCTQAALGVGWGTHQGCGRYADEGTQGGGVSWGGCVERVADLLCYLGRVAYPL